MLKFKSKLLTYIVNFFLLIWMLPQTLTALLGLAIFRKGEWYYNEYAKVLVYKVNKGHLFGNACFSSGPIIFVTPECCEETIKHETGHSVQSLVFGPLFHIVVSIPSICLFWYKRIFKKSAAFYHSHWPENDADKRGGVDTSIYTINS